MYQSVLKPLLFLLDAEKAHGLASKALRLFSIPLFRPLLTLFIRRSDVMPYECMGITFPSRLGLAAGFDKDAEMYGALSAIGFGFIEVGTVTPKAQAGNDKPRLFRLPEDHALINRMGFNNKGVDAMVRRLRKRNRSVVIGGNIGKNKVTPNENAFDDYKICFNALFDHVDYFTVNVSSPNTPGLRELQEKEPLTALLSGIQELNKLRSNPKPVLLKIAPDMNDSQLDDIVDIIDSTGIAGIIATNTTISRDNLKTDPNLVDECGQGGLSGQPLRKRSLEVVSYLSARLDENKILIGAGGISTPEDALNMLQAGASLVQIYTSFIYGGPGLVKKINDAISRSTP